MADTADAAAHRHGEMPVNAHANTYRSVMGLFKWGALAVACLLILLTVWFCTPAGFFTAAVVAAIVALAGVVGLRGRGSAH